MSNAAERSRNATTESRQSEYSKMAGSEDGIHDMILLYVECVCACVCRRASARGFCSFEEPQSIGLSRNFPALKGLRLKFIGYNIFRFSYTSTLRVHAYTKMTRKILSKDFFDRCCFY